ncbi:MAG: recombinase family protein [Clostridia bacterium]|nr:recombinase family protein [Clostridia bacterium]
MGKEWFYLRASYHINEKQQEQSIARQKTVLERSGYILTDDNTFIETSKTDENLLFEKMLTLLNENDWVIFSETSRLSQSYISGMDMLDNLLLAKKVNVRFVSNGIDLIANEQINPYTWYTISQTLLSDELQRRIIRYNTVNALEAKRRQGIILGRPRTIDNNTRNMVISMHNDGKRGYKIAEELNISPATVSNILTEYKKSKS